MQRTSNGTSTATAFSQLKLGSGAVNRSAEAVSVPQQAVVLAYERAKVILLGRGYARTPVTAEVAGELLEQGYDVSHEYLRKRISVISRARVTAGETPLIFRNVNDAVLREAYDCAAARVIDRGWQRAPLLTEIEAEVRREGWPVTRSGIRKRIDRYNRNSNPVDRLAIAEFTGNEVIRCYEAAKRYNRQKGHKNLPTCSQVLELLRSDGWPVSRKNVVSSREVASKLIQDVCRSLRVEIRAGGSKRDPFLSEVGRMLRQNGWPISQANLYKHIYAINDRAGCRLIKIAALTPAVIAAAYRAVRRDLRALGYKRNPFAHEVWRNLNADGWPVARARMVSWLRSVNKQRTAEGLAPLKFGVFDAEALQGAIPAALRRQRDDNIKGPLLKEFLMQELRERGWFVSWPTVKAKIESLNRVRERDGKRQVKYALSHAEITVECAYKAAQNELAEKGWTRRPFLSEIGRHAGLLGLDISQPALADRIRCINRARRSCRKQEILIGILSESDVRDAVRLAQAALAKRSIKRAPIMIEVVSELYKVGWLVEVQTVRQWIRRINVSCSPRKKITVCPWDRVISTDDVAKAHRKLNRKLNREPLREELLAALSAAAGVEIKPKLLRELLAQLRRSGDRKDGRFFLESDRDGVLHIDIIRAHKGFVEVYHRPPTVPELMGCLRRVCPGTAITANRLRHRIQLLRNRGKKLPLKGNAKATPALIVRTFRELAKELGHNPKYGEVVERLRVRHGIILESTFAVSKAMRKRREGLQVTAQQRWQSGGTVTKLTEEQFVSAYNNELKRSSSSGNPPSMNSMMAALGCSHTPIARVRLNINRERARRGEYPLLMQSELASQRILFLEKLGMFLEGLGRNAPVIPTLAECFDREERLLREQLKFLRSAGSAWGLHYFAVPPGDSTLSIAGITLLQHQLRMYLLWSLSSVTIGDEQARLILEDIEPLCRHLEQLFSRNSDLFDPPDRPFEGQLLVLRMAAMEGRLPEARYWEIVSQIQRNCRGYKEAVLLVGSEVDQLLRRAGLLSSDSCRRFRGNVRGNDHDAARWNRSPNLKQRGGRAATEDYRAATAPHLDLEGLFQGVYQPQHEDDPFEFESDFSAADEEDFLRLVG